MGRGLRSSMIGLEKLIAVTAGLRGKEFELIVKAFLFFGGFEDWEVGGQVLFG